MEVKDLVDKASFSFESLKSMKLEIKSGGPAGWGHVIDINKKNDRFSLGYKLSAKKGALLLGKDLVWSIQEVFLIIGYVYGD